jgi:hypothetical protein
MKNPQAMVRRNATRINKAGSFEPRGAQVRRKKFFCLPDRPGLQTMSLAKHRFSGDIPCSE